MEDGDDWVLRPWVAGRCDYRELVYGTELNLEDVARMNEALDVEAENGRRIREYLKNNPDNG